MSLFWTWFGFWGQQRVGFHVCLRLALQFSLYFVLTNLCFCDPGHFKAGMLHKSFPVWQRLLADYSCAVDLLEILWDGVRVENFFTLFRGDFKGQFYHAQTPPSIQIKNAAICAQFADFISDTIV